MVFRTLPWPGSWPVDATPPWVRMCNMHNSPACPWMLWCPDRSLSTLRVSWRRDSLSLGHMSLSVTPGRKPIALFPSMIIFYICFTWILSFSLVITTTLWVDIFVPALEKEEGFGALKEPVQVAEIGFGFRSPASRTALYPFSVYPVHGVWVLLWPTQKGKEGGREPWLLKKPRGPDTSKRQQMLGELYFGETLITSSIFIIILFLTNKNNYVNN